MGTQRLVVTLTGEAAEQLRRMAADEGITAPEGVRRGLMLYDLLTSLDDSQELVIRDKSNGGIERVRFVWAHR